MKSAYLAEKSRAEAFVCSLKEIALETGDTAEMLYKEFLSVLMEALRFQLFYEQLDVAKQFDTRPERNRRLMKIGDYVRRINSNRSVFEYDCQALRPFQRGNRVESMIADAVIIYQTAISSEARELIKRHNLRENLIAN